jgi:DNA gyrase subunit A
VNLLNLAEGEKVAECLAIRDFERGGAFLIMCTKSGLIKKTPLEQYSRPKRTGIIAINLKEGDELVTAAIANVDDEIIMSSSRGQAVRFRQAAARASGRNAQGVRGIKLRSGDTCVGMVVADAEATLLTVCEKGYGKRTAIGPNGPAIDVPDDESADDSAAPEPETTPAEDDDSESSSNRYPTKGRGTMGVRDIKTTDRNGPVVAIEVVRDSDQLLLMTARGKIQRLRASDISVIGRNTQGVRIMSLDDDDTVVAVVCVPPEDDATDGAVAAVEPS